MSQNFLARLISPILLVAWVAPTQAAPPLDLREIADHSEWRHQINQLKAGDKILLPRRPEPIEILEVISAGDNGRVFGVPCPGHPFRCVLKITYWRNQANANSLVEQARSIRRLGPLAPQIVEDGGNIYSLRQRVEGPTLEIARESWPKKDQLKIHRMAAQFSFDLWNRNFLVGDAHEGNLILNTTEGRVIHIDPGKVSLRGATDELQIFGWWPLGQVGSELQALLVAELALHANQLPRDQIFKQLGPAVLSEDPLQLNPAWIFELSFVDRAPLSVTSHMSILLSNGFDWNGMSPEGASELRKYFRIRFQISEAQAHALVENLAGKKGIPAAAFRILSASYDPQTLERVLSFTDLLRSPAFDSRGRIDVSQAIRHAELFNSEAIQDFRQDIRAISREYRSDDRSVSLLGAMRDKLASHPGSAPLLLQTICSDLISEWTASSIEAKASRLLELLEFLDELKTRGADVRESQSRLALGIVNQIQAQKSPKERRRRMKELRRPLTQLVDADLSAEAKAELQTLMDERSPSGKASKSCLRNWIRYYLGISHRPGNP